MSVFFEALLVFAVMSILVMLFAWMYYRDPQPKLRLWMFGWGAILVHFAVPIAAKLLPVPAAPMIWIKIVTLELAAACFFLSVCDSLISSRPKTITFLGGVTLVSVLYLTAVVMAVPYRWIYVAFLIISISTLFILVIRQFGFYVLGCLLLSYAGLAIWDSLKGQPRTGLFFYLSLGFGLTGPAYWRHFRKFSPGVIFTSLSFVCWGMVWPVASLLGNNGPPSSSFIWDVPKYFVAFGMIFTLFETHAEVANNAAQEYAALFECNLAAVYVSTLEGQLLDCNSAFLTMYGFRSKSEAQATSTISMYASPENWELFLNRLKSERVLLDYECQQRRSDGTFFWTLERAILRKQRGRHIIQGTLIDITERKAAELAIRESEERFATIFRQSPIGCAILSLDGIFLNVNDALSQMLKRPAADIIGKSSVELGFWSDRQERSHFFERLYAEGSIQTSDMQFKDGEGKERVGIYFATIIRIGAKECILGMQLDQTEQRQLETRCLQAEKMESLGRMAGGVAHDFNNVLGVIGGFAELLSPRVVQDEVSKRYCSKIIDAATRANGLTRQLLTFSRREISRPAPLKPARMMRELENILPRLIGEDIELILKLNARGTVIIDPTQFEQIIFNIIVNSRDAMPSGGEIYVEMEDVSDPMFFSSKVVAPGPYVAITLRDTGVGMDENTRLHAFEPFYTTKDVSQGTGLGLATVYAIVQQCCGDICIESHPGKGTRVRILLPAASEGEPEALANPVQEFGSAVGNILLVEDEAELREASADYLRSLGYSVLCAGSGAEALALAHDNFEIDLVISDVVMPKMNGRELIEKLFEMRPPTHVLFISGYADDVILRAGIRTQGTPFLQKPYSLKALGAKVHELISMKSPTCGVLPQGHLGVRE